MGLEKGWGQTLLFQGGAESEDWALAWVGRPEGEVV